MSPSNVLPLRASILFRLAVCATTLLLGASRALAADWGAGVGVGDERIKKISLIAGWDREQPLWQGEKWHLSLRHEVELGLWRSPHASDGVEFGYSPVLRMVRPLSPHTNRLFVEASVGLRVISSTHMAPSTRLSTAFQFSDMLGVGYQWGAGQRTTVCVRVVHLSNGGIKTPNRGLNFGLLYLQRTF